MDLPPELLDEIISHIPPDDKKSLRSCSLVAKSWVHPSRRPLFKTVGIWADESLKLWLDAISPTNVEVLQHVRSLTCKIAEPPDTRSVDLLRDYSPSFRQLERLNLLSGGVPSHVQIGTSQHTISYLHLQSCAVTASELVTFINYFPNLANLELVGLHHRADDLPPSPFSRPLRKLIVTDFTNRGLDLVDRLMRLHPQSDEVTVGMIWYSSPSLAQRVVDGVEASVKHLKLTSDTKGVGNPLSLSSCGELCELEIYAFGPGSAELDLISSITSTKIQSIKFTESYPPYISLNSDQFGWTQLDNCLCQLVDQPECGLLLVAEFQGLNEQPWWGGELGFRKYLPRSYEKGVGRGG